MFNAIYKFDAYRFTPPTCYTNKTWVDAYRGAGRPEATYAIERLMDELAAEVGVDPLEIREKNWIKHEEFPFTTVAGMTYDSGNYEAATARAKEMFGYDDLRAEQQRRRESDDPVQLGIGVSTFTEMCGLAPSRILGQLNYAAGGWEHADIRMLPTGKVEVVTGTSPARPGPRDGVVADRRRPARRAVRGRRGAARRHAGRRTAAWTPTARAPSSSAARPWCKAADKVIEKAKPSPRTCSRRPRTTSSSPPAGSASSGTDKGVTIQEIAMHAFPAHDLPDGVESNIDATASFDPDNFSFPHGTHLCAMEVDTETGR